MPSKLNIAIASVIGIDIGKNSFHVVGQDQRGAIVLRQIQAAQYEVAVVPLARRPAPLGSRKTHTTSLPERSGPVNPRRPRPFGSRFSTPPGKNGGFHPAGA